MKHLHACAMGRVMLLLSGLLPLILGQGCPGGAPPVNPDPQPEPDPGSDNDPPPPPVATACGLNGRDCDTVSGALPNDIVFGDINGNGIPDMAVVLFGTDTVNLLTNDGNGIFETLAVLPAGDSPSRGEFADFDGDGHLDFAVATSSPIFGLGISILANDGLGNFSNMTTLPVGGVIEDFQVADVNNNGHIDIVATSRLSNTLILFVNNGDGTFGAGKVFDCGEFPKALTLADLNDNGLVDVAVPNQTTGTVSILLNTGEASFAAPVSFAVSDTADSMPEAAAAGDFDGDGAVDLAVTLPGPFESEELGDVAILFNDGTGVFGPPVILPVGVNPAGVAVGDLNGDGAPDIAVANQGISIETSSLGILINRGDGTFHDVIHLLTDGGPYAVALADLDGDGDLDFGTANFTTNTITLIENEGF